MGSTGESLGVAVYDNASVRRAFDLATLGSSKRLFLVTSNGTANPELRVLSDGGWSAPSGVFSMPPTQGIPLWVELFPNARTDEVALVYATDRSELGATVWNGTSWTAPAMLSSTLTTLAHRPFTGGWENTPSRFVTFFTESDNVVAWPLGAVRTDRKLLGGAGALGSSVQRGTNQIALVALGVGFGNQNFGQIVPWNARWGNPAAFAPGGMRNYEPDVGTIPFGLSFLPNGSIGVTYVVGTDLRFVELTNQNQLIEISLPTPMGASGWTSLMLVSQSTRSTIAASATRNGELYLHQLTPAGWRTLNDGGTFSTSIPAGFGVPFVVK